MSLQTGQSKAAAVFEAGNLWATSPSTTTTPMALD